MLNSIVLSLIGIALGFLSAFIFNKLPPKWLCDYDEEPSQTLLNKRVNLFFTGIIFAVLLSISGFVLGLKYNDFFVFFILMTVLFCLVIISISDTKYTIIPDQFVLIILVCAIAEFILFYFFGKNIFYNFALSPLFGAIIGGGSMFIMSVIGKLFYKKDVMGFGDVKLFFACGCLIGINGAIFCFVSTMIIAAIFFLINMMLKRLSLVSMMPLGPFICISTAIYILLSGEIGLFIQWYLSLF